MSRKRTKSSGIGELSTDCPIFPWMSRNRGRCSWRASQHVDLAEFPSPFNKQQMAHEGQIRCTPLRLRESSGKKAPTVRQMEIVWRSHGYVPDISARQQEHFAVLPVLYAFGWRTFLKEVKTTVSRDPWLHGGLSGTTCIQSGGDNRALTGRRKDGASWRQAGSGNVYPASSPPSRHRDPD